MNDFTVYKNLRKITVVITKIFTGLPRLQKVIIKDIGKD